MAASMDDDDDGGELALARGPAHAAASVPAVPAAVPAESGAEVDGAGPRTVFLRNLSLRTTPASLLLAVRAFGPVQRIYMPPGEGWPNAGCANLHTHTERERE
jgi:hypothetical protein